MQRRACDRCHSIRARCQFDDARDGCERCLRLGHSCETKRKVLKAGRPRKSTSSDKDVRPQRQDSGTGLRSGPTAKTPTDVLEAVRDLDPREVELAIHFLQNQRFENSFVSESDLGAAMQSEPIRLFLSAPGRVKDALLALAGVMLSNDGASSDDAVANMDRCCKAMERLRQTDIISVDDAKATLFVATSLISVNDMTLGHGFLPIARAALLSLKPFYHDLVNHESGGFDPHMIPVLFAETSECVRCREVPTLRYDSPYAQIIDPSYGIAQEVLPHIYDICVLSHGMKTGALSDLEASQEAALINEELQRQTPEIRSDSKYHQSRHLSETQRTKIVKHGKCYKLLAQLLLHQLQPKIRGSDLDCAEIANQIFYNITTVSNETRSHVQYLLFPYFVACTELRDEQEQAGVLSYLEYLSGGIATQSCNRMFEFLKYAWAILSIDSTTSWLDLVEDGIQFSIGP